MHTDLAIHLSEHTFSVLSNEASAVGKTPTELATAIVEKACAGKKFDRGDADAANRAFEQCFGSIDIGRPIGIDNNQIDIDLGRAYDAARGK